LGTYSVNAPFVVVTVVVVCANARVVPNQSPTASKAAPIFVMFVFIYYTYEDSRPAMKLVSSTAF
jgi:hypothetical protein